MLYKIILYQNRKENCPFEDWLDEIDNQNVAIIKSRLKRVECGNFNNCKSLRDEIYEIIIDVGPGFRIYYANISNSLLILLGGIKRTQEKDITKAIKYLDDYKSRSKHAKSKSRLE